jgi:hypothetical protein
VHWQGPFQVLKKLPGGAVRIQRTRDSRPMMVHVSRLMLCRGLELHRWDFKAPVVISEEGPLVHEGVVYTGEVQREM